MILACKLPNNGLAQMDTEEIRKQVSECKILKRFDPEDAEERYNKLRNKINTFITAYDVQGHWKEHLLKLVEEDL